MNRPPKLKLGTYEHYKGQQYLVLSLATHSETLEKLVVYQPLYGDQAIWVRPYDMFVEEVEMDGQWVPRFRYLSDV